MSSEFAGSLADALTVTADPSKRGELVESIDGVGSTLLIAIDVATGARRDIGETRSVDDQVEWADDNNIIYALPNDAEGTEAQPVFDVWAVNVAPGSQPRLIIPFADSPAETS